MTDPSAGASDDAHGAITSRASGLAGWRKAIRRLASLEENSLTEIDDLYDSLVPKQEQDEWIREKLRLLKEESDAILDGTHSGLRARWEQQERAQAKKIAAAERQRNRQIESIKNMFESELTQSADESEAERSTYQQELLDVFQRRIKKLEDDQKILASEGNLESAKPQPTRKVRVRRGADNNEAPPSNRRRVAPFQTLMENGQSLTEEEMEDDFSMVQRLASKIGAS